MATSQVDTPQFDLSSAVPETDDGKAISALPAFDLNSAVPEDSIQNANPQENMPEAQAAPLRQQAFESMKSGIEQTLPSGAADLDKDASSALRAWIENVGKGGLEKFKEADAAYSHPNETPEQAEAELNKSEISKGVVGQLNDTFTMAMAIAAPEMLGGSMLKEGVAIPSLFSKEMLTSDLAKKQLAQLGVFMASSTTMEAAQKIIMPNMTPTEKHYFDVANLIASGGIAHTSVGFLGDFISKALTLKGISPTIDLQPDFLKLFAEPQVTERPAAPNDVAGNAMENEGGKVVDGGVLDKLDITQNHYDVSQSTGLPVRVPIPTFLAAATDPQWEKQMANFEGEGGGQEQGTEASPTPDEMRLREKEQGNIDNESGALPQEQLPTEGATNANQGGEGAQSGSGQEGAEGQAQAGVHLRDNEEGGMEAKAGEEVTGEKGTSKIAKSIEQKAKDAGMTEGLDKLSEFDKTTFKEQRELGDKTVQGNLDDARAMIRGEKTLPDGLRGIALIDAMERHIKTLPDGDLKDELVQELGSSKLVSETSTHAQETALAGMREPDSFTAKMNEINRAKVEAAGGDKEVSKATKKALDTYKKESSKVNLSKDELNWDKFLDGIKC